MIDSSDFIINKLGQEDAAVASSSDFSLGSSDGGLQSPDFSSDYSSSTNQQDKKNSSWKFW